MANTPELDLFIMDSHDVRLLAVVDISSYPLLFTITSPTLSVLIPGYTKEKLIPFVPREINVFGANSLGIGCGPSCKDQPLPDGIYVFKYAIVPAYQYNITKNFLRVDSLYQKYDEVFLQLEQFQCDMQTKRNKKMKLNEAETLIQGAIAAANKCANDLAMELYQKAQSILNQCL